MRWTARVVLATCEFSQSLTISPTRLIADGLISPSWPPLYDDQAVEELPSCQVTCVIIIIYQRGSLTVMSAFSDDLSKILDCIAQYNEVTYIVGDLNVHLDRQDDPDLCKLTELLNTDGYVAPLILVLGQLLAVPCISLAALASWPSRVTVKYTGLVFDSHTCRLTCCLARLCTVHASSRDLDLVLHVCWREICHSRCSRIIEQTAVAV